MTIDVLVNAVAIIVAAVIGVWGINKYSKNKHVGRDDKSIEIKDSNVNDSFNKYK